MTNWPSREVAVAWAAGFIDGEGYIGIYLPATGRNGERYPQPQIQAYNNDVEPLEDLKELFGGGVWLKAPAGSEGIRGMRHTDYYRWGINAHSAGKAAKELYPYLHGKRKESALEIIKLYEDKSVIL